MKIGVFCLWALEDYLAKRDANAFVWEITNASFIVNPDYK